MIAAPEQVLSRILSEDVLTPVEALDEIAQATGRRPDVSTIHRWFNRGVHGAKLESIRVGRRLVTSRQAIHRFLLAQQKR